MTRAHQRLHDEESQVEPSRSSRQAIDDDEEEDPFDRYQRVAGRENRRGHQLLREEMHHVTPPDIEGSCAVELVEQTAASGKGVRTRRLEDQVQARNGPLQEHGHNQEDHAEKHGSTRAGHGHFDRFRYRADVDGLRAVAVIAVISFHMNKMWLPGGFVGVDVFFVISGFVVCGSLLRKQHESIGSFILAFYARRAKRLAPALLLMVFATSLLLSALLPPETTEKLKEYYASGIYSLVGLANMHYAALPTGYFDEGAGALEYNPFTHCWSLGVEEQFYFCFPLLTLLCYRHVVSKACPVVPYCLPPSLLLGTMLLISALISYRQTHQASSRMTAYFLLPSRFWQLMSGAILFDLQHIFVPDVIASPRATEVTASRNVATMHKAVVQTLDTTAATLLTVAFVMTPSDHDFPMPWSLVAICGALCYIAAGCPPNERWSNGLPVPLFGSLLASTAPVYIGKISYPLYLWHYPICKLHAYLSAEPKLCLPRLCVL